jgi:hypothetical protein
VLNRLQQLPPPLLALLLQITAAVCTISLALFARGEGYSVSITFLVFLCGLLAALLSHLLGQAQWWLPIQLLFLPGLVATLSLQLSSLWFLFAFVLLLLIYWSTFRTQVPLYLSSEKVWRALVDLMPPSLPGKRFRLIDLGSGLGGVLAHLSSVRSDGQYFGVESAPLPYVWSRIRLLKRENCRVSWGSFWDCELSEYDVVFAYLSPVPMEQLWHKAKKEMKSGSLFISSTFNVPDQRPHETIQIEDLHRSSLLIWHM